ncbi:hypothetical protein IWW54_004112, partial [Coemansia sp. RSA 2705]
MVLLQRGSPAAPPEDPAPENTSLLDASKAARRHLLWHELPAWMRDNQYILSGYRPPTNSFRKCFRSWLYVHNETGNIMTHLAGALAFLVLSCTVTRGLLQEFATIDWRDRATLYAFLVGAVGCMGLSALFHTVTCHSHAVQRAYNQCDYVGIVCLIVGSCIPVFCYMFYCHPRLKLAYLSLIGVLGLLTVAVVVTPRFGTPDYRPLRAATFVALGLSGIVPTLHALAQFGWEYTVNAVQIPHML